MINAIGIYIGIDLTDEGIAPHGASILMESSGYILMETGSTTILLE